MNIDEKIVKLATDYVDKYDIEDATGTSLATLVDNILVQPENFKKRILSQEKFIENDQLNKQGLHLFRCMASEVIIWYERFYNYRNHPLYQDFDDNGILILENKLDWIKNPGQELWNILSMAAGQKVSPQPFRENVFVHHENDIQNQLHTDIFQPNVKSWMYLQDIDLSHGPTYFTYSSHINDERKLKWLYYVSNLPAGHEDIREGSFPLKDYKKWGFDDPKPVVGPKGTYFICDTCGFHSRGVAKPGTVRKTAKLHYRFNPFDLI